MPAWLIAPGPHHEGDVAAASVGAVGLDGEVVVDRDPVAAPGALLARDDEGQLEPLRGRQPVDTARGAPDLEFGDIATRSEAVLDPEPKARVVARLKHRVLALDDLDRRNADHRPAAIGADQNMKARALDGSRDHELGGDLEAFPGVGGAAATAARIGEPGVPDLRSGHPELRIVGGISLVTIEVHLEVGGGDLARIPDPSDPAALDEHRTGTQLLHRVHRMRD